METGDACVLATGARRKTWHLLWARKVLCSSYNCSFRSRVLLDRRVTSSLFHMFPGLQRLRAGVDHHMLRSHLTHTMRALPSSLLSSRHLATIRYRMEGRAWASGPNQSICQRGSSKSSPSMSPTRLWWGLLFAACCSRLVGSRGRTLIKADNA